jgi:hypothetical protein
MIRSAKEQPIELTFQRRKKARQGPLEAPSSSLPRSNPDLAKQGRVHFGGRVEQFLGRVAPTEEKIGRDSEESNREFHECQVFVEFRECRAEIGL